MISKTFYVSVFLITVQCGLVFSVDELGPKDSNQSGEFPVIPLSKLLEAILHDHHDAVDMQLSIMLVAASSGDRMYNLPVNVSAECSITARANMRMLEKLAFCVETFNATLGAVSDATMDLKNHTELKEHPLELVCRGIEKRYAAENANLSTLFEKARKEAANFEYANSRPPYFRELIEVKELSQKLAEKGDVPEIVKYVALSTFPSLIPKFRHGQSDRPVYFARTCVAVAKKENYADSMQSIYEKVINDDVLPMIRQKYQSSSKPGGGSDDSDGQDGISSMMKAFYGYISKDPILKKEVDDMAPIIGENAPKEDLDFSKL